MSIGGTTRPDVDPAGQFAAGLLPHVRQATAEITARVCATSPVTAFATAATGLVTGVLILTRHRRRR
jgi:hypothetical protein